MVFLFLNKIVLYAKQEFGIGNCGNHGASKNGGGLRLKKAGPCRVDGPVNNGSVIKRIKCVINHPKGAGNGTGKYDSAQQRIPCRKKNPNVGKIDCVSLKAIIAT
jgi:hypothetical protein